MTKNTTTKIAGYTVEISHDCEAVLCDVSRTVNGHFFSASLALICDGGEMTNFDGGRVHSPDRHAIEKMTKWAEAQGW